jgi:hypothetical protein
MVSYILMAGALKEEGDIAGEFKLYNRLLGVAQQWSEVELQSGFGLEYVYHSSARLGRRGQLSLRINHQQTRSHSPNFKESLQGICDTH